MIDLLVDLLVAQRCRRLDRVPFQFAEDRPKQSELGRVVAALDPGAGVVVAEAVDEDPQFSGADLTAPGFADDVPLVLRFEGRF